VTGTPEVKHMKLDRHFINPAIHSLLSVLALNTLIYTSLDFEWFTKFFYQALFILGCCAIYSLISALKNLKISIPKKIIIGVVVTAVYVLVTLAVFGNSLDLDFIEDGDYVYG
jgi:amino acid transporter